MSTLRALSELDLALDIGRVKEATLAELATLLTAEIQDI
jgi:hypothetical protein